MHRTLNPDTDNAFWNYSFHEIGVYDVPAIIAYILRVTGHSWLHYVCHSQGCTVFFVMASELPKYSDQVRTVHAMAPAVFLPKSKAVYGVMLDFMDQLAVKRNG